MAKCKKPAISKILNEAQNLGIYSVGQTIEGLAHKLSKKPSEILKLNSNENFFVPLDFLKGIMQKVVEEVDPRIYPRDEYLELKKSLSRYLKTPPETIVVGTGSDQLIDLASRMLLRQGDEALSIAPTFSIYERCVRIQRAIYRTVPLRKDFSLDTKKILTLVKPKTKLLFLCSPNNPTANSFDRKEVLKLADSFEGIVAVDEAYIDFSDDSLIDVTADYENLVVFRTFSKVFGLAGLRLGCMVTNHRFAKVMDERFQMPYSASIIALKTALKVLERTDIIKAAIGKAKVERSKLIKRLNQINKVRAFDSETNFVLFQVPGSSKETSDALLNRGVIVRNIGRVIDFDNCLRVTVAPSPMMEKFLDTLGEVLS